MKPIDNWNEVQEAQEFKRPTAGGYVCGIYRVEHRENEQYLLLDYDIIEGEFRNYYKDLFDSRNFWGASFIRSYKKGALPFFKGFITAIEKSNRGYKWNWQEKTLEGKKIGLVLQEEEYQKKDGSIGVKLVVQEVHSVDEIRKGNYTVKPRIELDLDEPIDKPKNNNTDDFSNFDFGVSNDDIQF